MKILLIYLCLFYCIVNPLFSQNTGIGTVAPSAKLEVQNAVLSDVKISSQSYQDTSRLILSNRAGNAGTDFILTARNETGLYFSTSSDFASYTNDSLFTMLRSGAVGVGTKTPGARLDVNGGIKIRDANLLELGAGIAGKEINAGKMGYNAFGATGLTFVGAGTNSTNRAVYFFAEGGTTLNGPLTVMGNGNFSGQLRLNGNAGLAGQVLTSNSAADPAWQTPSIAYDNNVRFSLLVSNNTSLNSNLNITTRYNTNATVVSVPGSDISFNQTGLYHFEGAVTGRVDFASALSYEPKFFLNMYINGGTGPGNNPTGSVRLEKAQFTNSYNNNIYFSMDLYLTAGQVVNLVSSYGSATGYTLVDTFGYLRGYLIQ